MTREEAKGFIQGKLDCMNMCDVFDCKGTDECDSCNYCYSQGNFGEQKKAFEMAIELLGNDTNVGSKWIPCSERLPIKEYEIDKRNRGESAVYPVLVTMKVFDFEENEEKYLTHELWFFDWKGELGFYNEKCEKVEVIAWQPLPEPYEEELNELP